MSLDAAWGSLKVLPKSYGDSGQHFTFPLFCTSAFVYLEILCLDKKQRDPRRYSCCNITFLILSEKIGILYSLTEYKYMYFKNNCVAVWDYHWTQRAFCIKEYFRIRSAYSCCLQHCIIDMAWWKEKVRQSEVIKDKEYKEQNIA